VAKRCWSLRNRSRGYACCSRHAPGSALQTLNEPHLRQLGFNEPLFCCAATPRRTGKGPSDSGRATVFRQKKARPLLDRGARAGSRKGWDIALAAGKCSPRRRIRYNDRPRPQGTEGCCGRACNTFGQGWIETAGVESRVGGGHGIQAYDRHPRGRDPVLAHHRDSFCAEMWPLISRNCLAVPKRRGSPVLRIDDAGPARPGLKSGNPKAAALWWSISGSLKPVPSPPPTLPGNSVAPMTRTGTKP